MSEASSSTAIAETNVKLAASNFNYRPETQRRQPQLSQSDSHRNREQPTPDPNEPPLNQIKFYLDRYRIKEALQIFFDEHTLSLFKEEADFMWDLVPLICKRLRGLCQYRFRVFEGCERMLCRIAIEEHCNPKEVLISLLAEISQPDQAEDDNVFRAMIRPLEGTLLRMKQPSPRDENFRWSLNVLIRHINDIDLPNDYNLEGKKRLTLANEPNVKRYIEVLPLLLNFIEEFDCKSKDVPAEALIRLANRPLTYLDLTCSELRLIANKCLNGLLQLRPNLFSPIYNRIKLDCDPNSIESTSLPLATFSYIYHCERLSPINNSSPYPLVTTYETTLLCHIPYVIILLDRAEVLAHEKGLILLENLLRRIELDSLDQVFLDVFETSTLNQQLFKLMVFSPLCTNRRRAYDLFTYCCDLLTNECKLKLFRSVFEQGNLKPCVRAACIDQYRKHLTKLYTELVNLRHHNSEPPMSDEKMKCHINDLIVRYRSLGGKILTDFLDLCVKACLPDSQHTDIIENYELLLATLTMFRFLKLRKTTLKDDSEENYLTGKNLKKKFFDPIRDAIALTVNELKLHYKEIVEGHRAKEGKTSRTSSIKNVSQSRNEYDLLSKLIGPKLDELVESKEALQEFSERDETECLNWALCRLDLVESVLVRTCDLYDC